MNRHDKPPRLGDRVMLACSCEIEIVLPVIILVPLHSAAQILSRGDTCRVGHTPGRRVMVRSTRRGSRRVFVDVRDSQNQGDS